MSLLAAELTNYLFIWSALFGAAYGFKTKVLIFLWVYFNWKILFGISKFFLILQIFSNFIFRINIIFWISIILMLVDFGEMSVDLNIPMWIPHLGSFYCFCLLQHIEFLKKLLEIYKTDSKDIKFITNTKIF